LDTCRNNWLAGADILTLDECVFDKQDRCKTGMHDKKTPIKQDRVKINGRLNE